MTGIEVSMVSQVGLPQTAGVVDEGDIRMEERKEICSGAMLMAAHTYTRNPESPLGKEIDLQQWETLIFKGEHAENDTEG